MTLTLTPFEADLLKKLLTLAADEFGNHGCNDFPLPNTSEVWDLYERVEAWNHHQLVAQWRRSKQGVPRPSGRQIYFLDWALLEFFASLIS